MVHDFEGGFQFSQYLCIYRGLGKSEIRFVFLSIPYRLRSKIGAIDQDSRHEFSVLARKCHPGVSKSAVFVTFADFLAKVVKTLRVLGHNCRKWPEMARIGHFVLFYSKWPELASLAQSAINRLVFDGFFQKSQKNAKTAKKSLILAHF